MTTNYCLLLLYAKGVQVRIKSHRRIFTIEEKPRPYFLTFKCLNLKQMNGLTTSVSLSSWGEQKTLKAFVCEIIDSKLDFIELKTRRLLDKFRRKDNPAIGSHRSDDNYMLPTMSDLHVNKAETEQIFEHIESFSRSICILEHMKFSLSEDNVCSIMELLNDDKYLTFNDMQIEQVLKF